MLSDNAMNMMEIVILHDVGLQLRIYIKLIIAFSIICRLSDYSTVHHKSCVFVKQLYCAYMGKK